MSVSPITAPLSGVAGVPSLDALSGVGATAVPTGPSPVDEGFAATLTGQVDALQGLQSTSSDLAQKAVTGDVQDVHTYMIAATEAQVATEMTVALRNKAVEAFTEIIRMPL